MNTNSDSICTNAWLGTKPNTQTDGRLWLIRIVSHTFPTVFSGPLQWNASHLTIGWMRHAPIYNMFQSFGISVYSIIVCDIYQMHNVRYMVCIRCSDRSTTPKLHYIQIRYINISRRADFKVVLVCLSLPVTWAAEWKNVLSEEWLNAKKIGASWTKSNEILMVFNMLT